MSTSPDPAVARALDALNEALRRDPAAITALVNMRLPCNTRLSGHATVQTSVSGDKHLVGVLGLINGILGYKHGGIGAVGTLDPGTRKFRRIDKFVHTRAGK